MGWSIGYDENWERDIGYGVPASCDQPCCNEEIDRGLSHVCGGAPYGGDHGCGLYFCQHHLYEKVIVEDGEDNPPLCMKCCRGHAPYDPKPDVAEWVAWKLTDDSWERWRKENQEEVKKLLKYGRKMVMDFK